MLRDRRLGERAGAHDAAQVALHQRHLRAGHRHVGAGAHGDADVGAGQRRRVVDAVAGHRHAAALALAAARPARPCPPAAPRRALRRCRARAATARAVVAPSPVAMTMRSPPACSAAMRVRRGGLDRIGHRDQAGQRAIDREEHHAGALRAQAFGLVPAATPTSTPSAVHQRARCRAPARWPSTAAAHADAGDRFEVLRRRKRQAAPARFGDDGLGQRMLAALVQAGGQAQHLVVVESGARAMHRRGTRACLRSACRSCRRSACRSCASVSIASASRNSTPACAARPVATMIDIGVASPSAHGQAMISTDTALSTA